jgi:hypothetical protein
MKQGAGHWVAHPTDSNVRLRVGSPEWMRLYACAVSGKSGASEWRGRFLGSMASEILMSRMRGYYV